MSLYAIEWLDQGPRLVVGGFKSILGVASLLEGKKMDFFVNHISGGHLSQTQCGAGGFVHWKVPKSDC